MNTGVPGAKVVGVEGWKRMYMCVLSRWNTTSCCSGASRRQISSAIKPSRRPLRPSRAPEHAAACPVWLPCPTWRRFWRTASSPSTRLSSPRSSPASKRPKRTSVKTDVQSRTVTLSALPNDPIIHHPEAHLCLIRRNLRKCFAIKISRRNKLAQSLRVLLQSSCVLSIWHVCFC